MREPWPRLIPTPCRAEVLLFRTLGGNITVAGTLILETSKKSLIFSISFTWAVSVQLWMKRKHKSMSLIGDFILGVYKTNPCCHVEIFTTSIFFIAIHLQANMFIPELISDPQVHTFWFWKSFIHKRQCSWGNKPVLYWLVVSSPVPISITPNHEKKKLWKTALEST